MVAKDSYIKIAFPDTGIQAAVYSLSGSEQLGRPFEVRLSLVVENDQPAVNEIIGESVVISFHDDTSSVVRRIHGIIAESSHTGFAGGLFRFDILVVPPVWLLKYRQQNRIFQNEAVENIIASVLEAAGISREHFDLNLQESREPREYCVQYQESDFDFVHRLMEEEGIYYQFDQTADSAVMHITDHASLHSYSDIEKEIAYQEPGGLVPGEVHISQVVEINQLVRSQFQLGDYNYLKPALDLTSREAVKSERVKPFAGAEWAEFPGDFRESQRGSFKTRLLAEREQVKCNHILARGEFMFAHPGILFDLHDYPVDELNQPWLVSSSSVTITQPEVMLEQAGGQPDVYMEMQCIPASVQYRMPAITVRPRVQGIQTAVVAGPEGEEIYTDEYGRIKICFPWDQSGTEPEQTSCWTRVSQSWSGTGWGSMFIPRIGTEVLVDFVDGNPDRPLVTGQVYHSVNRPPYELPANKTRSIIRSSSSTGGEGYNEIRFEDKAQEEELYFRAQKNLSTEVLNDSVSVIGNDQHCTVGNDRIESIAANQSLSVGENQTVAIGDSLSLDIGGQHQVRVAGDHAIDAGDEIHVKAGSNLVLEAGAEITLKAGGSFITIGPAGVTVEGSMINLNSGGSAGDGKGVSIETPTEPLTLENDGNAQAVERPQRPSEYSPAAMALKQASADGSPFCEQCEQGGEG